MYFAIGTLMTFIMIFGIAENFVILYTFFRNKKIRTIDNVFIVGVSLSDIGQAIFGVPFVVIASFSRGWKFDFSVCQYYAFVTTFLGISQVAILTVLAVERYFIIVRGHRNFSNSYKRCIATITCSFLYGLGWATGPLAGWSSYEEESEGIACSVSWEIVDPVYLSYTISLFTFGWFLPLILIVFGYCNIAWVIYNERVRKATFRQMSKKHRNRDKKVAITVLFMIGAFIVSWLPYSAISLWSAAGDFKNIPVWAQVAPAVFAKCSIIWNPIIYVARHSTFRKAVMENIICFSAVTFDEQMYKSNIEKPQTLISHVFHRQRNNSDIASRKRSQAQLESFCSENNITVKDDTGIVTTNISETQMDSYPHQKRHISKRRCSSSESTSYLNENLIPMVTFKATSCHSPIFENDQDSSHETLSQSHKNQTDESYNSFESNRQTLLETDENYNSFENNHQTLMEKSTIRTEISGLGKITTNINDKARVLRECDSGRKNQKDVIEYCDVSDDFSRVEESVEVKRFGRRHDGKLHYLKKRRLKLRKQLACLYFDIYNTPTLALNYPRKSGEFKKNTSDKLSQSSLSIGKETYMSQARESYSLKSLINNNSFFTVQTNSEKSSQTESYLDQLANVSINPDKLLHMYRSHENPEQLTELSKNPYEQTCDSLFHLQFREKRSRNGDLKSVQERHNYISHRKRPVCNDSYLSLRERLPKWT